MLRTQTLDVDNFSKRKTSITYPNFVLRGMTEVTPVVVPLLDEGEVPVISEYNGKKVVVARMTESAYNVWKLLRTHEAISYNPNETESYEIRSIKDYLDLI